jgi:hypothetical protein
LLVNCTFYVIPSKTDASSGAGTAYPSGEREFTRHHKGQMKKDKRTNSDLQNLIHKIKDEVTQIPLTTEREMSYRMIRKQTMLGMS